MSSAAQILANQQNSLKSSGPTTPAGKHRSAINATRHGFAGHVLVLTDADMKSYLAHSQAYMEDFQPKGANELDLVQELADLRWAMKRMRAIEQNILSLGNIHEEFAGDIGPSQANSALDTAVAYRENHQILNNSSTYYARKHRAAEKTLKILQDAQAQRKQHLKEEIEEASVIHEAQKTKGKTWDPKRNWLRLFHAPDRSSHPPPEPQKFLPHSCALRLRR